MPVVLLQLLKYTQSRDTHPLRCPSCNSQILQSWGKVSKPIHDYQEVIDIERFKCMDCNRIFRHYPKGLDRSNYTASVRRLAALLSVVGLSVRTTANVLKNMGVNISSSTVWREGQDFVSRSAFPKQKKSTKIFSIDKKYIHKISSKFGVVLAVDLGMNEFTIVGTLDEYNPREVIAQLKPFVEGTNIEILQLHTGYLDNGRKPLDEL